MYAECVHVCVWLRLVSRLWRWRLYIEGSCPVCQRALSATLFSDKALVKGLTPTGHGCWGERAAAALQTYSPAGGGYLSPPSPLLRLADTLNSHHHHPQGRPYLTLSLHARSCLSTHIGITHRLQPFTVSVGKPQTQYHFNVHAAEPDLVSDRERIVLENRCFYRKSMNMMDRIVDMNIFFVLQIKLRKKFADCAE